jgi:hypothetical protein
MKSPPSSTDRVHQLEAEIAALCGRETEELRALRSSNRNMAQHIQALSLLVRKSNGLLGFKPNRRGRDALQRSSRLPRRRDVDEFFLARIARAGSGSHGPTG